MTAPRFAECVCGHPRTPDHDRPDFELQCVASGCTCVRYRPKPVTGGQSTAPAGLRPVPQIAHTPPAPVTAVPVQGPTIDQLIAAAKRSSVKRTVTFAEKLEVQIRDLRTRLHEERRAAEAASQREQEKEAARQEVARLEAQLAAAKAKLRGQPTPPQPQTTPRVVTPSTGQHACTVEGCDRTFDSPHGVALHRRRAHEGFDPRASKAG